MKHSSFKRVLFLFSLLSIIAISCTQKEEKKIEPTAIEANKEEPQKKPLSELTAGARTFLLCTACHNLKKGEPHKVGPNLNGIFGRKAASLEDFAYSEALQSSGIVWDEEQVRKWLEKPSDFVPGTTMAFIGISNKGQLDTLIKYLKEESK